MRSYLPKDHPDKPLEIGSEPTPEAFVSRMVEISREVRRVLRDDGTLWVNLGDNFGSLGNQMLMPHRVALAMQADGWILRSTIVWHKKSPMPESISGFRWRRCRVKVSGQVPLESNQRGTNHRDQSINSKPSFNDGFEHAKYAPCPGCPKCHDTGGYVLRRGSWRPTNSFEYIFLFTKTAEYFCDGDAVQEPVSDPKRSGSGNKQKSWGNNETPIRTEGTGEVERHSGIPWLNCEKRNPRSVWTLSSEREKAKHFATFPSAIPRKCLTAATSKAGCCPKCGACYAPVVESDRVATRPGLDNQIDPEGMANRDPQRHVAVTKVSGYRPTCQCNAGEPVPCLVADIFSGSGTTGRVAYDMGLRYIGLELSEEYAAISREKIVRPFPMKANKAKKQPTMAQQARLFA